MACADFDGQVVRRDPDVARLAERFVCVRIQSMNGININLFQFDYDLTWMAFFMDAEDHFYARYGGREDASPESHLTKASLVAAMQAVLSRHARRSTQKGKYEPTATPLRTPEGIASLQARMAKRKPANRCIHCHDVKQGELESARLEGRFTRSQIYGYPMPSVIGIEVDPDRQSLVRAVKPGSIGQAAGVLPGDLLQACDSQRILTAADFARVLHLTPDHAELPLDVVSGNMGRTLKIRFDGDWRRSSDPSWRSSTYVAGPNTGFWGEALSREESARLGLAPNRLAVKVTFLFKDHPAPVRSGLKLGDVLVAIDGDRQPRNIRQIQAYFQMNRSYGEKVPINIVRDGKEQLLLLHLQDGPAKLN